MTTFINFKLWQNGPMITSIKIQKNPSLILILGRKYEENNILRNNLLKLKVHKRSVTMLIFRELKMLNNLKNLRIK